MGLDQYGFGQNNQEHPEAEIRDWRARHPRSEWMAGLQGSVAERKSLTVVCPVD